MLILCRRCDSLVPLLNYGWSKVVYSRWLNIRVLFESWYRKTKVECSRDTELLTHWIDLLIPATSDSSLSKYGNRTVDICSSRRQISNDTCRDRAVKYGWASVKSENACRLILAESQPRRLIFWRISLALPPGNDYIACEPVAAPEGML